MTTQTGKTVDRHILFTDRIIASGAKVVAIVTSSALLRRQANRTVRTPIPTCAFGDVQSARTWLLAQLSDL